MSFSDVTNVQTHKSERRRLEVDSQCGQDCWQKFARIVGTTESLKNGQVHGRELVFSVSTIKSFSVKS